MRRRGFSLPETLIAAILLTVGVAAVAATIILSLRMIVDSEAATIAQQSLRNDAEKYLLKRSLLHEDAPETSDKVTKMQPSAKLKFSDGGTAKTLNYSVYRYMLPGRTSAPIYIAVRDK